MQKFLPFSILQRYVLGQFLSNVFLCLFAATSLFLVFDFFERMRVFIKENSTVGQVLSYLFFKIPLILHLMMPVAVLIAVLLSVGRLSQKSELTAMRACGSSLVSIAKPLIAAGFIISVLMFALGEWIVPIASQRVEEIYTFEIRKKDETGGLDKSDIWYRANNKILNIGKYSSSDTTLHRFTLLEFDETFRLKRRVDAPQVTWEGNAIGWSMKNPIEMIFLENGNIASITYPALPLVTEERPQDFYNMKLRPETLSYRELQKFINKRKAEGIPVTPYLVDSAAKISFPFVSLVVVLIAFPFALTPARSGTMTLSFVSGIAIGFSYYFVHAFATSLGAAELIPILPAAWTANTLLGGLGAYLMAGMDQV